MKAFEIQEFGIENLALVELERPRPKPDEALVRIHAASLNYRDLRMVQGTYNPKLKLPMVPFSDGAGEVVEAGESVTRFKVGDRVCPIFMQGWLSGEVDFAKARTALGGDLDGVLREYAVFNQQGLVSIPEHLSYEEAATLPCAAVTAWHALADSGNLRSSETVLTLGTGGVSIFALQFAKAMGAKVIATSSSNEKLERVKRLGADLTINYKEREDWDNAVKEMTEKRGADHVIEVGGPGTLQRSINSVKMGGHIAFIGVVAGKGEVNLMPIFMKTIKLQGIFVGSRQMFEAMNAFISEHKIKPVIDKVFNFEQVQDALKYMESGAHFGKIVIRVNN
jgi:2-desacetyl-2-hydroxyethyl bacteriochlorophyllide A dehydrogenase